MILLYALPPEEPPSDEDELSPLYNPVTADDSPSGETDDLPYPDDDLEPLYNPITGDTSTDDAR